MKVRLNEILEAAKERFKGKAHMEAQLEIFRLIREQQHSGKKYGLQEGEAAKDFTLNNAEGEPISLFEQLAKGPVVLNFYRGGWCPFCNLQLRAYQDILPEIEELGAQLIALSPQSPEHTLSQKEIEELRFQVLSDTNGQAAELYDVLFELPLRLQEVMTHHLNMDVAEYNRTDRWILPIPSTFIIDRSRTIRSAYVNPDFMQRLEPRELLERLSKL